MSELFNLEAEAELLGQILCGDVLFDRVADALDEQDFYEPVHQRIFAAVAHETARGKRATPVTLKPYFDGDPAIQQLGGITYLAKLSARTTIGLLDVRDLSDQLRELSQRRRIQVGLATASAACADLDINLGEIVGHVDSAFADTKDTIHQPTGAECFDELLAGFAENAAGVACSRIPELDGILGPLRPKQLVVGAGRPGMGKTAVALSYALGAAMNGHGVLFVSLEMSSRELAARMAADLCFDDGQGIPFAAIRDGDVRPDQHKLISEAGSYMRGLPFQVVDAGHLTLGRLSSLVRRHARRMAANGHKLELVVVDYLQLLSPDQRGRSNYEAVSEVSRGLKALAKDAGVSVMALAQLSREVEKRPGRRPQLADLRDSGQIEQDADAVFFLLRPEYYLRQEEPDQLDPKRAEWEHALRQCAGQIEFIVAKRRNGTTGTAIGRFYGAYQAVR